MGCCLRCCERCQDVYEIEVGCELWRGRHFSNGRGTNDAIVSPIGFRGNSVLLAILH